MTQAEKDRKQEQHIAKSIEYRGKLLNAMVMLEFMLNGYVARYFCGDDITKMEKMILYVLGDDRMSLGSKAQVFYQIANTEDKKWFDKYKSPRKPTAPKNPPPNMNNDLNYVIQERNVFAHRIVALNDTYPFGDVPENTVRFVKFKNDLEPLDYTKEKFDELYLIIIKLGVHFADHELMKSIMTENTLPPST